MKKVIFCNISYMKNYVGISEDDAPANGGKYVADHADAHEKFNFLDFNGKCYGYCPFHVGEQINLDRIAGTAYKEDSIDDVLVVWTARRDELNTRVIVGWYDHATVYRRWQNQQTYGLHPENDFNLFYFVEAAAKDCYLLPESKRTFVVPNAAKEGKGRGMGQSPIWYADSEYARKEYVPEVLEYIMKYDMSKDEDKYINFVITPEFLEDAYHGENGELSAEELEKRACSTNMDDDPLYYLNALLKIKSNAELLMLKAKILCFGYSRFDEAISILESLVEEDSENTEIQDLLFVLYCVTEQHEKAVVTGQWLENCAYFQTLDAVRQFQLVNEIAWQLVSLKKNAVAERYLQKLKAMQVENTEEDIRYLVEYLQQGD